MQNKQKKKGIPSNVQHVNGLSLYQISMPSTTGSLGITIKTTNKGWFQNHIVTVHTTQILL